MKIKYNTDTSDALAMGSDVGPLGASEALATVSFPVPAEPLSYFTFNGLSLVRKDQSVIDALVAIANFDFKRLWGTVLSQLPVASLISIGGYQKNVEDMWKWPNRGAIYPFFQALQESGKATADDLTALFAAFADQDIDITTIQ